MTPRKNTGSRSAVEEAELRGRIVKLRWMGLDSEADELAKRSHHDACLDDGLRLPPCCPDTD